MLFYFFIFSLLACFSLAEIFSLDRTNCAVIFLTFSFCLFLLSFLRWETGTDWDAYLTFFTNSNIWLEESEFEWGFSRVNELVRIHINNFSVLLFILGAIVFSFQSKAILKLSTYPITSLFILWSVSFGNIFFVRQTLSVVILIYSIKYIQQRFFWRFLLMIGFAMLFHRTAIIFVMAYWVYHLNLRPLTMALYILVSIFLSALIVKVMETFGALMGGIIESKLNFYLSDSDSTLGARASLSQIIIKGFANKIFIFVASVLMLKKIDEEDVPIFRGYLNLYFVGIVLYFCTISVSIALVRLSFAYDMVLIFLIPLLFKYIDSFYPRFIAFLVLVLYLGARLYIAITASFIDAYIPFRTIFN